MSSNNGNGNGHNSAEYRWDAGAFYNSVLGFGNVTKDKLEGFHIGARRRLTSQELFTLFEQNQFISNAVSYVPDAACQKYCEYESDTDVEEIQKELDRAKPHINQAWKLARLQGWAAVLLLIDDGEIDYSKPVNLRSIRGISGYNALSGGLSGEIGVAQWDENPLSVTYGEPELFSIAGSSTLVHVSRLLLFYGVKRLSRFQARSHGQLGTSIIDRCYQEFRNFDVGNNSIAATLPDFNLDIFVIPRLAELMAKQKDFAEYISGVAFARSVLKVMLVEAGEGGQSQGGYQIVSRQYAGITNILDHFTQLFCGATDIPRTMLMNESPSGQTSGRYQLRSWAQYVSEQQKGELDPQLRKLIGYLHHSNGNEPQNWTLGYPSILELDESEQADIELKKAQRLQVLTASFIATPEEAAEALSENVDVSQTIDLPGREAERQSMLAVPEGLTLPSLPATRAAAEGETLENEP